MFLDSKPTATAATSGGLFQFMRKTKKLRHQPEQQGVYLEELKLEDLDPEVASLYVYGSRRC